MNTETIAMLFSGFGGLCLLGGIVAMRFAVQAGRAPAQPAPSPGDRCAAMVLQRYVEDDTPTSQRDTLPGSAPATLRSSTEGVEYGE